MFSEGDKEKLNTEPVNNESFTKACECDEPGRCYRRPGLKEQIKKIFKLRFIIYCDYFNMYYIYFKMSRYFFSGVCRLRIINLRKV